jgi:hypothetical protein
MSTAVHIEIRAQLHFDLTPYLTYGENQSGTESVTIRHLLDKEFVDQHVLSSAVD